MKDIFYDNGFLNKNRLRENWCLKNLKNFDDIKKFQIDNNFIDLKFSQVIFNYIENIITIPNCEYCGINNKRFVGFTDGYNNFCSKKCAALSSIPKMLENRKINTIKKYGVQHTSQLQSVKDKQKETNIIKYGTSSPTLNEEVRTKQKNTMLERYGVKYSGNSDVLLSKSMKTRYESYSNHIQEIYKDLKVIKIIKEGELEIQCDECKKNYKIRTELLRLRFFRYKVNPCLICNPINSCDGKENEIYEFLQSYNLNMIRSDRKILDGKEIDIYLPDQKIGIEFNGLYWHSDIYKDKNYHLDKKLNCSDKGINLIHIWEDDWLYKKEIVKSRLLNLLVINGDNIMARKCVIKNVSRYDSKKFIDENHLQGYVNSSYKIGLYYNDELVSIMTFGKLRRGLGYKNKNGWELYRFCSKLNTNVVGGFTKLLSHFENEVNPNFIITYANRDWSIYDNVYHKNNFEFAGDTEINYWYFNRDLKRYHRFRFRKDILISEGFDKSKTEYEIMFDRGYNRVFDCGNLKYIKNY